MADLEEGELPSDEENEGTPSTPQVSEQIPVDSGNYVSDNNVEFVNMPTAPIPAQPFRNSKLPVAGLSSSEESSDESDDSGCGWVSKAKKKKMETMDTGHIPWGTNGQQSVTVNLVQPPGRKVNNIWGSVLQEQTLSHTMVSLGVDKLDKKLQMDRDVESYDFTRAKLDSRPHKAAEVDPNTESNDPFDSVIGHEHFGEKKATKRKRPVKERLGKKKTKEADFSTIEPKLDDSEEKVASDIVTELEEPNTELIGRVVRVLGIEKSLELLKKTQKTEAEGGILTFNKERRRTPGGVYIFLLKTDPDVEKKQVKAIFYEDVERSKKEHRANQKKKLKRIRDLKRKKSFDIADEIKDCLEKKAAEIRQQITHEADMEGTDPQIKQQIDVEDDDLQLKQEVDLGHSNLRIKHEKDGDVQFQKEADMEEADLQSESAEMISLE